MLVPPQDHVDVGGRGERLVLGHLHVRDRDHQVGAPRSEARGHFRAERNRLSEHDVRPGP